MSARLRSLAEETTRIVEAGAYPAPSGRSVEIGPLIRAAVDGTRMHGPEPLGPGAEGKACPDPSVEVTAEASLAAARRMLDVSDEPVAVLNFASARNPGGGFLRGAQAQEEYLCRNSALYACLRQVRGFYDAHRAARSPFYSDRVIHSPGVPVFRGEDDRLLEQPFTVGFLTSAAPNAGVVAQRMPREAGRLPGALRTRAEQVLGVAARHGYRRLVLGAWGCGVFRNRPAHVAEAFRAHLGDGGAFADRFSQVVFAVLDRRADSPARAAFAEVFTTA